MRIIAKLLQSAAPLKPGFCITIHNSPWPDLVIRDMQKRGPHRLPSLSVAHLMKHDGQSMRTPEMLFEVEQSKRGGVLTPIAFVTSKRRSSSTPYGNRHKISVDWRLQSEHMIFARQWNASLEHQGFVAAFHRAAFIEQLRQEIDSELSAATDVVLAELNQLFERAISKTVAKTVVASQ